MGRDGARIEANQWIDAAKAGLNNGDYDGALACLDRANRAIWRILAPGLVPVVPITPAPPLRVAP